MVPIQRNAHEIELARTASNLLFASQRRSWVAHIRTEDFVSDDENAHAGGTWETQIDSWVFEKLVSHSIEGFVELFLNFGRINHSLVDFSLIKCKLYRLLNFFG